MAVSPKAQGRQWARSLDRVVIWRDTGVPKVREVRPNSCKQRVYLDGVDPGSTFIRTDAPPFPPYLGGDTDSTSGGEQQGRDQCDTKDVKESHPRVGNQMEQQELRNSPHTVEGCFYSAKALPSENSIVRWLCQTLLKKRRAGRRGKRGRVYARHGTSITTHDQRPLNGVNPNLAPPSQCLDGGNLRYWRNLPYHRSTTRPVVAFGFPGGLYDSRPYRLF